MSDEIKELEEVAAAIAERAKSADNYVDRRELNREYDYIHEKILHIKAMQSERADRITPLYNQIMKLSPRERLIIYQKMGKFLSERNS